MSEQWTKEIRQGLLAPNGPLWSKVDHSGGHASCWHWLGRTNHGGYGELRWRGIRVRAHRAAFVLLRGPIPDGKVIDHRCRNRACVNPLHLDVVTQRVNVLRGIGLPAINAAKACCVNGHAFTLENTHIRIGGHRSCRTCGRERARLKRVTRSRPHKPKHGEHNGNARLSLTDVVTIKNRLAAGESLSALGRAFGVTPQAIRLIRLGKTWSNVNVRVD